MARPVTLFSGQWADLPLTELAEKARDWGYDGLELGCWGDHFDPSHLEWQGVDPANFIRTFTDRIYHAL